MKKLLLPIAVAFLFLIGLSTPQYQRGGSLVMAATNCALTSGATQSTIQSALTAAGGGTCTGTVNVNTVALAAGTYGNVTSAITIPCNAFLTGPVLPYQQTHYQTAKINGSGYNGWGFQTTAGCPQVAGVNQSMTYIEWNGNDTTGNGGGGLRIVPGTTNFTAQYDWCHGVGAPGAAAGQNMSASCFYVDNSSGTATVSNVLIDKNEFGSESLADCQTEMTTSDLTENGNGGNCNGVGIHNNVANVVVTNNIFHWLAQGMKVYEHQGMCNPLTVQYNDFSFISRIMFESQCNIGTASQPTLMYIQYNSWHDRYPNSTIQTFDISSANGTGNSTGNYGETHTDYNVYLGNTTGTVVRDVGIEVWGQNKTTADGNLIQGNKQLFLGIDWSQAGNFDLSGNNFQMAVGGSQTCATSTTGYWSHEVQNNVQPAFTPTCNDNTYSTTVSTVTSAQPTLSPAVSGTFTTSQLVTLTNTGTGRDANTTIWYTLDGSTPTPGSSLIYTGPFTITSTKTVKARGMWGHPNQPNSYPSGYGYVPSPVVSAVYTMTGAGAKTLSSVALSLAANDTSIHVGQTNQASIVCSYSDGSTDACGPYTVTWASSSSGTATISSSGLVYAVASGTSNISATVSGVTSNSVSLTVASLSLIALSSANGTNIHAGATSQITATCNYSNGFSDTCNTIDLYDYTAAWTSSNPSVGTVNSAGLFTAVAAGSTNVTASAGSITGTTTFVVTSASLSSIAITLPGGSTSLQVGGNFQISAICTYSDSSTAACSPTGYASSVTADATVDSSGAVMGVSAGSTNLTATLGGVTSNTIAVTVVAGTPVYSGSYLATPGNINSVSVGTKLAFSAVCLYTDGSSDDCTAIGGVTGWTSSITSQMTISPFGVATAVAVTASGTPVAIMGQVGTHLTSSWNVTITPAPALSSVALTLFGGATSIPIGANVQEVLTCTYADGSNDNCTSPSDSRGNIGSAFTSSNTVTATVSSSGLVTPLAAGTTILSATAGGKTSTLTITVTGGAPGPTLVSAHQTNNIGGTAIASISVYSTVPIQQHVLCVYSDSVSLDCTFGDSRGSAVTAWSVQNTLLSVGAVGSAAPGVVSANNAGTLTTGCTVTGGIACAPYTWLVFYPANIYLSAPGMSISGTKTQ